VAKARLKTDEIERIVDMLTSWRGDLTWDRLLQRVEKLLRRSFTRQGLAKQENIQTAYQQAKDRLRTDKPRDVAPRLEIELLQSTIESLRARIAVIEAERGRFEEKFATWLYNARSRGISELDLNRRLPDVDRDGSVKER